MLHDLVRWMNEDALTRPGSRSMALWDPWRMFDELPRPGAGSWPAFDLRETDDALEISADVPGLDDEQLEINVVGKALVISGHRELDDDAGSRHRRFRGSFEHRFALGDELDIDRIDAMLRNGVLTIRVPKLEAAKPRRVALSRVIDKVKGLLHSDDKEVRDAKDATTSEPAQAR
jgi:HSP20 family protein